MIWAHNTAGHPRLGLIVPKYRQTGVARNRLMRRLREIVRRELLGRLPALDVLVRARREAYDAPFTDLRADLMGWAASVPPRAGES